MKIARMILTLVVAGALLVMPLSLSGCKKEDPSPAEQMGEAMDDAA